MKALIVEDSKIVALAIKNALNSEGYDEVKIVDDGNNAVNTYKAFQPDVITMDINMPGTDGINITRNIFSIDRNAKVIVITELNLTDDQIKQLEGVIDIVLKPVTIEKIEASLAKV